MTAELAGRETAALYSPAMKPTRLKVTDERGFEKTFLIDKDVFPIGREATDGLWLPDEAPSTIAAQHALLIRDGDTFVLKDQSGPRGTRVNGRPIRSTVLKHGDQIALGASSLRILFLVEGTRASDFEERRIRLLLEVLRELHSALEPDEVCARAVAGITGLIGSAWAVVGLQEAAGRLEVIAALDRSGTLPGTLSGIALHVERTSRSYFHPVRLCVPIMSGITDNGNNGSAGLIGVIDAGPREAKAYQALDLELLEALAVHVGIALTHARRVKAARPVSAEGGRF